MLSYIDRTAGSAVSFNYRGASLRCRNAAALKFRKGIFHVMRQVQSFDGTDLLKGCKANDEAWCLGRRA